MADRFRKWLTKAFSPLEKQMYLVGALRAESLTLPDFLGIGAQKAGTTWLYENLKRHPGFFLPRKEMHYFNDRFHQSLASYAAEFEPGAGRIKGEITPAYSILAEDRVRFIARVAPRLKLIFLMRDPLERAFSQAHMNLVSVPGRKLEAVGEDEFIAHFQSGRSMARGDYLSIIDRWLRHFPAEALFVGFYDDVKSRPTELFRKVLAFLGAPEPIDLSGFPLGKIILPRLDQGYAGEGVVDETHAPTDRMIPPALRAFLETIYRDEIERIIERFGGPAQDWRRWRRP